MILRALGLLCCLALEAAAVACWLPPSGPGGASPAAWPLHILAAALFSLIAARSFHSATEDTPGRLLFAGMLFLFCALVPAAGLLAGILMLGMLHLRKGSPPVEEQFSAESPLARLRPPPSPSPSSLGQEPLVTALKTKSPAEIRRLVLGLGHVHDRRVTGILEHLRRHHDHRVQLFANGVLSDRLERLETRLEKIDTGQPSANRCLAKARIFLELLEQELLPETERGHCALRGIAACDEGLAEAPASVPLLLLKARLLLATGSADQARDVCRRLEDANAPADELAAIKLRILYHRATLKDVAAAFRASGAFTGDLAESRRFWVTPPCTPPSP